MASLPDLLGIGSAMVSDCARAEQERCGEYDEYIDAGPMRESTPVYDHMNCIP